MLTLTILVCWYHHTGTAADDIAVLDMLIAFRRTRITAITADQTTHGLNDHDGPSRRSTAA